MESIFNLRSKEALLEFIEKWAAIDPSIDKEKAFSLAMNAVRYYGGGKAARAALRPFQEQETRWYESLAEGTPDYESAYGSQYIMSDLWACWVRYSSDYLKRIREHILPSVDMKQVSTVLDLGCGISYATAGLKELFPAADVYGTNFEGGIQWKFAQAFSAKRGFSVVSDVHKLGRNVDFVLASEYFEHIEDPVAHLIDILKTCDPKYIVTANAFGTTAIGHFIDYKFLHDIGLFETRLEGKAISRLFNKTLRNFGYEKVETKCWNGRPNFWRKKV